MVVMELVNLRVRAKGYYSFASYEENRLVKLETYKKIHNNLVNKMVCITDLDGRDQDCYAYIEINNVISDNIGMQKTGLNCCDGYHLKDVLVDVCHEHNIDFCEEENEINRYTEDLDMYTEIVCYIPESKKKELKEFVSKLISSYELENSDGGRDFQCSNHRIDKMRCE